MLNQIAFMTDKEKKACVDKIAFYESACKQDQDALMEAFVTDSNINTLIHVQLLKADVCQNAKIPVQPFTKEQYKKVADQPCEEGLRKALCETLAEICLQKRIKICAR